MPVLQLVSVSFSYGGHQVFRDVDLTLEPGERVGVVGPNGVGKTTLLRLAVGELEPEAGRISRSRDLRLAFLRQDQHAEADGTVLEALLQPFADLLALRRELARLERAMAAGEVAAAERYGERRVEYEAHGGDAVERRVEQLADDLELGARDLHRPVRTLSGGERRRLALAQVLAGDPELLLLDEPTNHLDLDTMERLEEIVRSFAGAVLVVSHDRAFLDAVCPITAELAPQGCTRYPGPYRWYVEERQRRLESEQKAYDREKAERERQEELIRRTVASGGFYSRQAKARQRRLERLDPLEAPTDVWSSMGKTLVRPPPAPRSSRVVLQARELASHRGGRRLFHDLDLQLLRGDRLGIVGPNGAGKTTLLRALMGEVERGEITLGNGVVSGICGQELEEIHPESTPIAELHGVRPDLSIEAVRSHLGMLRIRGEDQERKNGTFSGGERARVALAKLLAVPRNLLALDEPTNNLDIPAREVLEEGLRQFDGTVIVVSHDRYFLDRVATRFLHIGEGETLSFDGTYGELRRFLRGRQRSSEGPDPGEVDPDKERRKAQHQARKEQKRLRERLSKRQRQLEEEISRSEVKIEDLEASLAKHGDDWQELQQLQERLEGARVEMDRLLAQWTEVSEELEGVEQEEDL